ncbi:MAG: hypothetical protein ACT4NP_16800 [Pseudonocardiales bacterium]
MRTYQNLLRRIVDEDPRLLADLPWSLVLEEAGSLLRCGDVRVLEQLCKHAEIAPHLDSAHVSAAARAALRNQRVDDFCFLFCLLDAGDHPSAEDLRRTYSLLAQRGNAAGIEQIANLTGVAAQVDEASAVRAYDVLVAAGRLGAADYIRQLSGVPIVFTPDAVRRGATVLLLSGKYSVLRSLARSSPTRVALDPAEVAQAADLASEDGRLDDLAAAVESCGGRGLIAGFAPRLARLLHAERFDEVPALFVLCCDADLIAITDDVWCRILTSASAPAIRWVFERHPDAGLLRRHAPAGYRVGVDAGDRKLVRLACERGGATLIEADVPALLDGALDDLDIAWVSFVGKRLGSLVKYRSNAVHLFLAEVEHTAPDQMPAILEAFGGVFDRRVADWARRLTRGDLGDAVQALAVRG